MLARIPEISRLAERTRFCRNPAISSCKKQHRSAIYRQRFQHHIVKMLMAIIYCNNTLLCHLPDNSKARCLFTLDDIYAYVFPQ